MNAGVALPQAGATAPPTLLRVQNLSVHFGGVTALDNVSFDVKGGSICGIIGPNGAGKTTLFNCLSRICTPSRGEIHFDGKSLLSLPMHAMAGLGIGRTFQNLALFPAMSVLENVAIGAHGRTKAGFLGCAFRTPSTGREERRIRERAVQLLSAYSLVDFIHRPVAALPFATRKRIELARAMASEPKLLLLDEPAAGLNHQEVGHLRKTIEGIRDSGVSVLLVEHHMNLVMSCSDQVVALNFGRTIAAGDPASVGAHPDVISAYLGDETS